MKSSYSPVIVFFGSSLDSCIVLSALLEAGYSIACVVTQPERPIGREQILTKTPVQLLAESHHITLLHFETSSEKPWLYKQEEQVIHTLQTFKPDLFVTASYGQLIPWQSIESCSYGGINIHPSLLPRWRGADPTPWTILANDHQTGVSIVTLSQQFDEGTILAQKKFPMELQLHASLRKMLFTHGAELLIQTLPTYLSQKSSPTKQHDHHISLARRLQKQDGYIPWPLITSAMEKKDIPWEAIQDLPVVRHLVDQLGSDATKKICTPFYSYVTRLYYALHPWPGIWTIITIHGKEKRMKILDIEKTQEQFTIKTVHIEGKTPTAYSSIAPHITL